MYEALAYLKAGSVFSLDDLERAVNDVIRTARGLGEAEVSRSGRVIRVEMSEAVMEITEDREPKDLEVCQNIAKRHSVDCPSCPACFAFFVEDPEMELFNHYLLILERLHGTGLFVIFDYNQRKVLFT